MDIDTSASPDLLTVKIRLMAGCSKYLNRLKKAMEYNGVSLPDGFVSKIAKRAKTDGQVDSIALSLIAVLEPPYCKKSHCPHHTTYGFAGCSKSLVPGKCKLNLEYIQRTAERELKIKNKLIAIIAKDKNKSIEYVEANFDFAKFKGQAGGISRVFKHYESIK